MLTNRATAQEWMSDPPENTSQKDGYMVGSPRDFAPENAYDGK